MPVKEISNPNRDAEPGLYAADVAVAQRIVGGDDESWKEFSAAIRGVVTKVLIDWCHRIAPGGRCRHCVAGIESGCPHFSGAEAKIDEWIRQKAMKGYKGQTSLGEFVECLAGSNWWFWDYTGVSGERLATSGTRPAADGHRGDLVQAWAVLAGSRSAWDAFLGSYNKYVEMTAIAWCHRSVSRRVCQRCKPSAYDADQDCDAASDAYTYILDRLKSTALASYCGRTALGSFVYLCLRDHRWWASLVQKETGKIKLPKALENESQRVHQVYYRMCWGWDSERIAVGMRLSQETVEETRARIEEILRSAGRVVSPRKIRTVSLSAVFPEEEEEPQRVAEPKSSEISPEVRSEAVKYWSKLSVPDRTLLRLVVESEKSTTEIAKILGLTAQQVYGTIYRIRREMPEWFKMQPGKTNSCPRTVQIVTEGDEE